MNKTLTAILALTLALCASALAAQTLPQSMRVGQDTTAPELDSNTAFFQGQTSDYVIYPPSEFKLLVDEAVRDGYSLAFVPKTTRYDSSGLMITTVYYDLYKKRSKPPTTAASILLSDTTAMRKHYGDSLMIGKYPDTVTTETGQILSVYYFEDTTRFIPNVMTAYLDGGTELLIFELTIALGFPRFEAEEIFLTFVRSLKTLTHGELNK